VGAYLQTLPKWAQFSPALPDEVPNPKPGTAPEKTTERIDKLLPGGVNESQQDACLTTTFSMKSTPEKIVMFSPDRELLWPGALIQGKSHRDGVGSLLGLPIRERTPIKVSIPSLATADNFRLVSNPEQAEVNHAIGQMIDTACRAPWCRPARSSSRCVTSPPSSRSRCRPGCPACTWASRQAPLPRSTAAPTSGP